MKTERAAVPGGKGSSQGRLPGGRQHGAGWGGVRRQLQSLSYRSSRAGYGQRSSGQFLRERIKSEKCSTCLPSRRQTDRQTEGLQTVRTDTTSTRSATQVSLCTDPRRPRLTSPPARAGGMGWTFGHHPSSHAQASGSSTHWKAWTEARVGCGLSAPRLASPAAGSPPSSPSNKALLWFWPISLGGEPLPLSLPQPPPNPGHRLLQGPPPGPRTLLCGVRVLVGSNHLPADLFQPQHRSGVPRCLGCQEMWER